MKSRKLMLGAISAMVLASAMFVSCEEDDLYKVNAPADLQNRIDEAAANAATNDKAPELTNMLEDVYTIGNTDYSSGWWSSWSKYYVIPDDTTWNAVFNLHINPDDATKYYQNFALVVTNDVPRGGDGYIEYGAIRYDATGDSAAYNSLWGTHLYFKFAESTLSFNPVDNVDKEIQQLGGKVTLSVTRTSNSFSITMANANVTKTYKCPYALANINADQANKNIRCFLVPEGSYIDFMQTNIEPEGGCTSASDKMPVKMVVSGVPQFVEISSEMSIDTIVKNVEAVIEFEEGVTSKVKAEELTFMAIPDLENVGKKILVVSYAKSFKGEAVSTPVMTSVEFDVVNPVVKLEASVAGKMYYIGGAKFVTLTPGQISEIKATYSDGTVGVIPVSLCSLTDNVFSTKNATGEATLSYNNANSVVSVKLPVEIAASSLAPQATQVGATDFSTGWWLPEGTTTADWVVAPGTSQTVSMKVGSDNLESWHSPCTILRKADMNEYAVVRMDNWGWGGSYDAAVKTSNWDWDTFKSNIDGSEVAITVSNNGDGTADIRYYVVYANGEVHFQYYDNLAVDANDVQFGIVTEESYLIFD
ncbi:MAG: hypothetical protein MJZ13_05750 [Bacteroidales bacterium]|nr:hypothetical protein [Bacteroidales bacterium]